MREVLPPTAAAPAKSSDDRRDARTTHRPGAVLACVSVCTVLVVGFVASINLAILKLAASSLHPGASAMVWIVDAYVIVFACLVIPAGALGDRVGRKGVLITGLVVFAVGAGVSAAAGEIAVMLAGRVITGVEAACVLPNALAVLINATESAKRPGVLAVWAAMAGIGGVVGNVGNVGAAPCSARAHGGGCSSRSVRLLWRVRCGSRSEPRAAGTTVGVSVFRRQCC